MSDRLTFLILTAAFLALYSSSSVAGGSSGVAIESLNGTRKTEAKIAPSVKVTDASAKVIAGVSKVTELPIVRKMEGSGVTVSTLTTERPSTVRSRGGAKTTSKAKAGRAHSGEDEDEEEEEKDDYYDDKGSNTTNIVDAPCPQGLQRDPNGTCRQHLFVINDNGNHVEIVPYIDIEEIIGKEDFGNGKKPENVTAKGTPYSIVYAPCPTGTRKDENGNCRQSLD